jgi:hypothetical protein
MAENSFSIYAGPIGVAPKMEDERGNYQVTVINQSNHNCTGGIISLRSTSGEFQQWNVPYIAIGGSATHVFSLGGQPSVLGWDLASDVGTHWGPGAAPVTAASFPLRLPLQPF